MSPLIWIQPATLGGLFFARNFKIKPERYSGVTPAKGPPALPRSAFSCGAPLASPQNLYETARNEMIGSAFKSAFETPSSVPSAALIITDDVVFSGM